MIILLEGPDGVGKSTLADAIVSSYYGETVLLNNGPPPPHIAPYLHYMDMLDDVEHFLRLDPDLLILMDRFHVGELIYAPMFRGSTTLTVEEARLIDARITAMGGSMFHCFLDRESMVARQLARDGGAPDPKSGAALRHSYAIRTAFIWACGDLNRPGVLTEDWSSVDMRRYPDQIANTIHRQASFRKASKTGLWHD